MLLRGSVGGNKTQPIDRVAPTVSASFQYPGGNVAWSVYTEVVASLSNGYLGSWGFADLKMTLVLIKR